MRPPTHLRKDSVSRRASLIPLALLVFLASGNVDADLEHKTLTVGDARREYLLHMPDADQPAPLVFVFHGHGGTMQSIARRLPIHDHWPEAIVVYMQGLKAPGRYDPAGFRTGWQKRAGELENRDLRFFDAVYESLLPRLDTDRVFATGHSNGGRFAYLLWAFRGDRVAAVAPSSSTAAGLRSHLVPKPVLHLAGRHDTVVSFASQQATIELVLELNECGDTGLPWKSAGAIEATVYECATGYPVVTLIHDGGHRFPDSAPGLIAAYFGRD